MINGLTRVFCELIFHSQYLKNTPDTTQQSSTTMIPPRLQTRLTSVSTTYKQTIPLIHRLQSWTLSPGQGDDARLELAEEIHHRLKEMEEDMELLRVEAEPLESMPGNRRRDSEEKEELVAAIGRLGEDMRS